MSVEPGETFDMDMMIKKEKVNRAARRIGGTAVRLLYPPRCPLCDQIRPARSAFDWEAAPFEAAQMRRGAACVLHQKPMQDKKWADQSAADRREGALPCDQIRPARSAKINLVCDSCRPTLPWVSEPACMKCGKPLDRAESEYCEDCTRTPHLFDQGRAAFAYSGAMRHSVYRMKFQNRRDYLDFYAEAMVQAGQRCLCLWQPQVIVPVPMHWKKRAARGYNQSELLAVRISRLTGIPCDRKLLRCVRYTGNQKELNRRERLENLRGSFEVRLPESAPKDAAFRRSNLRTPESSPGSAASRRSVGAREGAGGMPERRGTYDFMPSRVLLVDDVYTTGSTMDEAARALREAGAQQIYFLTICIGKGKKSLGKSLHDTKSVLY
ncbi:MAG: ComF family protein [Lachnospiraceae bacterium]|nr:ComF family protein [Lachnospiraceae bacterium]